MFELRHVKGNTYYIESPAKIGLYIDGTNAYLIDSGNDKDAGRKVMKLLREKELNLQMIINTHSNADHIGGNKFLQDRTNCRIAATEKEAMFIKYPELEASFLYGGYQYNALKNKFLQAQPSNVTDIIVAGRSIECFDTIELAGHFHDMIAIETPDNVIFLADSLFSKFIVDKYSIFYLFDVEGHLDTLDMLKELEADVFIPSHGESTTDISELIEINQNKINEVIEDIKKVCMEGKVIDDIIAEISNLHGITIDANQYVLIGSCIKSYLSYMENSSMLEIVFNNNKMFWKTKQ